jgi:hypothetical protein
LAVALASSFTFAQDYTPKVELGLGYSYSRAHVPNAPQRTNMHGVLINFVGNVNRWLGAEAEFGTHYHCAAGCWDPWGERIDNPDARNDSLSFLAGPKLTLARKRRISPWVHALIGWSKVTYTNIDGMFMRDSGLGLALGGGLDMPIGRAVTVRAIQVDYTRFAASTGAFNNMRIGAGIVLRVGAREEPDRR